MQNTPEKHYQIQMYPTSVVTLVTGEHPGIGILMIQGFLTSLKGGTTSVYLLDVSQASRARRDSAAADHVINNVKINRASVRLCETDRKS